MSLQCFTSPLEGMTAIEDSNPDIVFMDIEMHSHNGIELARRLPRGTSVIFTTAYPDYAIEGFNVNAVDFIQKPVFYPRFVQAINKALAWNAIESAPQPRERDIITLKSEHRNVVISLDSITHIEAMDNYVKVFRRDLPVVISQITMKEVESLLPEDSFSRVHRSFIVNLKHIDSFSNRKIIIHNVKLPIPVGRTYNPSFITLYKNFNQK